MTKNVENIRIFGGEDDRISCAAIGSTLPTTLADPAAPFADLGWLGEDGITITPNASITKFKGHQGARIVRTKVTESGTSFKFQCLETTALTLGLQLNIKTSETTAGLTTMKLGSGYNVLPRAFVVDGYDADDADKQLRLAIPRGEIGERSEFKLANSDLTVFEYTVEIIGDFFLLSNDPALASA
ncbi:phage tail tube protein [Oerskovia jenensis]|uniref:phage tail tube protein n=1 Tax=Oerskovia jenensis TaxID=162169 RepID=UPI0036D7A97F